MQKTVLIFIIFILTQLGAKEAIGSLGELRTFMEKGQKEGYFPKTVPIDDPLGRAFKLETVDLLFRKLIRWNSGSRCPTAYDQIILATGNEGHYIVCNYGRAAVVLGSGDDEVEDATGNDIYYPGGGNDTLSLGSGSDIIILGPNWGNDRVKMRTSRVDTSKILGYDGSFPYRYGDFVIFTKEVAREDIVWRGNALCHRKTDDCLYLPNRKINVLFASHPKETDYTVPEEKIVPLSQLRAEGMWKKGNLLYVARGDKGLEIVDVTNPDAPVVLSETVLPGRALSVTVKKRIAYVAQGDYMLEGKRGWVSVVDVHDAKYPKVLGNLVFGNIVRTVAVKEGVLYVPVNHKGRIKGELNLYAVGVDRKPVLLQKIPLSLRHVDDIAVFGRRLYVLDRNAIVAVFDIANPKLPQPVMRDLLFGKKGYALHVQNGMLAFIDEKHRTHLYRTTPNGALMEMCALPGAKGQMFDSAPGENKLFIDANRLYLYRAQGAAGIAVYDLKGCKEREGVAAGAEEPSVSAIVRVGSCLLSFQPLRNARCYPLERHKSAAQKVVKGPVKKEKPISRGKLQQRLYKAALYDKAAKVKRLLKLGANPNLKGHENVTPMQIAARVGSLGALKAMLEAGGKADDESMILAALTEKTEAMKLLERYGGNIRAKDSDGCTTLHYIASDGPLEMVKYLIEKGVPYNVTCRKNEAPIHWANAQSNCPVIRYLESLYPKGTMKIINGQCEGKEQSDAMRRRMEVKRLETGDYSQLYQKIKARQQAAMQRSRVSKPPLPRNPVKIKAKQKGNMLHVKFMIKHPMISPTQAMKKNIYPRYIEHIDLRVGRRLIADISTGYNISKNPIFKFKNIKNSDTKSQVHVMARENTGKRYSGSVVIKIKEVSAMHGMAGDSHENTIDYHRTNPGLFDADAVDDALEALYGKVHYEDGGIEVTVPKVVSNSWAVPVTLKSDLDLESVAVLTDGNAHPAVAVFHIPKGVKVDIALKMRVLTRFNDIHLIVVGKGRDGRYHIVKKPFVVAYGEAT